MLIEMFDFSTSVNRVTTAKGMTFLGSILSEEKKN